MTKGILQTVHKLWDLSYFLSFLEVPTLQTWKPDTLQPGCHQHFCLEEYLRGKAQSPAQKQISSIRAIKFPIKAPWVA